MPYCLYQTINIGNAKDDYKNKILTMHYEIKL